MKRNRKFLITDLVYIAGMCLPLLCGMILKILTEPPSRGISITGARALKSASILGVIIHMLGGILGVAIMVTLTLMGRLDLLTPANMFAYQLVWMIPGLLITEWTRAC